MSFTSVATFIEALRNTRILPPAQLEVVTGTLQGRFIDPRQLAKDLLLRGWLTAYQINQLFQGQGKDLILGSYVLLERLGEGSMGLVYKAKHQTMGRLVALKVIRRDRLTHPNAVRRFQREVRAIAQLSHPNVAIAYDADQVNGTHFIAMEYIDGKDLGKIVRLSGPLPIVPACHFIRQAALCLQYVHERGLVHRDIKPSNMLVAADGTTLKVLDMGLARLNETDEDSDHITQEGFVVGTADFIAPEQARNSHAADIRSDIYSLGCTFYFLLTGSPPFPVKGLQQKLMQHQLEPPPPVESAARKYQARVLVVIRRMMAKRPADRYPIPGDVASDLTYILTTGGLPDRTRPPSRGQPVR